MLKFILPFTAFFLCIFNFGSAEGPVVDITGGKFQGTIARSHKDRPYYSFKGIPFAKPPVDDLRYEVGVKPVSLNFRSL